MITIVSGLPRSGTSMMMRMLAAGGLPVLSDGARAPDPDNPHGYYEDERVKRLGQDAMWLGEAEGKAVKVVAPLLALLPAGYDYRVVFLERDLDEVLASQAALLVRTGHMTGDPSLLRQAFTAQLDRARTLLCTREAWTKTLYVSHRSLLAAPVVEAERIARFVDGALDVAAMAAVVDPALHRQRHPPG